MLKLISIFVVAALCLTGIPGTAAWQTPEFFYPGTGRKIDPDTQSHQAQGAAAPCAFSLNRKQNSGMSEKQPEKL